MSENKTLIILGVSYCLLGVIAIFFEVSQYVINCVGIGSFLLTLGQLLSTIKEYIHSKNNILFDIDVESKKSEILIAIAKNYGDREEKQVLGEKIIGIFSYILYGFGVGALIVVSNLHLTYIDNEKIGFIFTSLAISIFFLSTAIENYKQYVKKKESEIIYQKAIVVMMQESSDEFYKKENIDKITQEFKELHYSSLNINIDNDKTE